MAENLIQRANSPAFLQTLSLGFKSPALMADTLSPRVPVDKQEGKYRAWGKGALRDRSASTRWAPGMIPNAIGTSFTEVPYGVDIHVLRHPLYDHEVVNADADLNLRNKYTETTTNAIAIAREVRTATLFTTAANYPGAHVVTKAGGQEWNLVPANVLTDLQAGIALVALKAMVPTSMLTIALPQPVFDQAVKFNASISALVSNNANRIVTTDLLATILGVKEVLLVAVQTVGAGLETEGMNILSGWTSSYLWGDNVWIGYIDPTNNDQAPTFSRSLNWKAGTGGQERQVRQYRMPDEGMRGDWIEVAEAIREVLIYSEAGYLVKNTLSTL